MGEEERLIKGRASGLPDLPAGLPEGYGCPAVSRRFRDARPQTARGSRAPEAVEAVHEVLREQFPREGAPALEEHAADAPGGQSSAKSGKQAPAKEGRRGRLREKFAERFGQQERRAPTGEIAAWSAFGQALFQSAEFRTLE